MKISSGTRMQHPNLINHRYRLFLNANFINHNADNLCKLKCKYDMLVLRSNLLELVPPSCATEIPASYLRSFQTGPCCKADHLSAYYPRPILRNGRHKKLTDVTKQERVQSRTYPHNQDSPQTVNIPK
jgi:hypothetical protein